MQIDDNAYDDEGIYLLLAALCALAHRDASSGNGEAKAWIADVATVKPRNMRIVPYDDPFPPARPGRRRAA